MTLLEKCQCLMTRGFVCNPETGQVFNPHGKELKCKNKDGYVTLNASKNGKQYKFYAHQFIWWWVHKETVNCIDHINRNESDNRIINLRGVTRLQNQWNQKERKGYTKNKRDGTFTAQINVKEKHYFLGNFKTEQEASNRYNEAKKEIKNAILNGKNIDEVLSKYKAKEPKGVSKVKGRNLFEASIKVNGERVFRKFYKTESEAAEAYKNKKEELKNLTI